MWHLFKTQFLHHNRLALGLGLIHFMAIYYPFTLGTVFYQWSICNIWALGVVVLSGLAGLLQMLQLRRSNEWLYLLHRPLSQGRIFFAVSSAGTCNLVLVILLPALAALVLFQSDGRVLIEARHYQFPLYLLGISLTGYFCGCFAALSPNRLAIFSLVLFTFIIGVSFTIGLPVFLTILVVVTWALHISYASFKADLSRLYQKIPTLVLTELPIQYGILWGLAMMLSLMQAISNDNMTKTNYPTDSDGYVYFRLTPKERMQFALEQSDHPQAAFLRQQVGLSETVTVALPDRFSNAQRFQLPQFDNKLVMTQPDSSINWSFRHSDMVFVGTDSVSGEHKGWLGMNGFSDSKKDVLPFRSIPWVNNNRFILEAVSIHELDWETRTLYHRYDLPETDSSRFTDSLNVGENLTTLLSEQNLYIFSTPEFTDPQISLQARAVFHLPSQDLQAPRYDVMELIDGFLLSALTDFGSNPPATDFSLMGNAKLQLYRVGTDKPLELIGSMPLASSVSDLKKYQTLILSPGMRIVTDAIWGLIMGKTSERTWPFYLASLPVGVLGMVLASSLISTALTGWLLRRSTLPSRQKIFWLALTAFSGFVGLISFFLGTWWRRADQFNILETDNARS